MSQSAQQCDQLEANTKFRCPCQKVYKSYPALYTHIKNKHPKQIKQFQKSSKRPKDGEIDKGRPKKHRDRPEQVDQQGELINIIQLGVLDIEKTLKNHQYKKNAHKFEILEGNSKLQINQLQQHYKIEKQNVIDSIRTLQTEEEDCEFIQKLMHRSLDALKYEEPVKIFKEQIKFKNELIQHFNEITAAKILIHIELVELENEPVSQIINAHNGINFALDKDTLVRTAEEALWDGKNQIANLIRSIYFLWHQKLNQIRIRTTRTNPECKINPQKKCQYYQNYNQDEIDAPASRKNQNADLVDSQLYAEKDQIDKCFI